MGAGQVEGKRGGRRGSEKMYNSIKTIKWRKLKAAFPLRVSLSPFIKWE